MTATWGIFFIMFTGLIQCTGTIKAFSPRGREATLTIDSTFDSFVLGESIAINGVCLSVTQFNGHAFSVFASAETLQVSGVGELKTGTMVNLEKALTLSTPLGGHLVSGHVDTRVRVVERVTETEASRFRFAMPKSSELAHQIAAKGSVAIDGVSLTVNRVTDDYFEVMVIPITLGHTTLGRLSAGTTVNLETDILAKYVARHLNNTEVQNPKGDAISMELLTRNGFMR